MSGPEYANGQCAAITKAGKRCSGGWGSAMPCVWAWDPIRGVGVEGPNVILCHRHRHYGDKLSKRRFRIVGGWLGAYNRFGYGSAVWAHETGWQTAKRWWAKRAECIFGKTFRRDWL